MIPDDARQCLKFVAPDEESVTFAENYLRDDLLRNGSNPNHFSDAVASGDLLCSCILRGDDRVAVLWWHKDSVKLVIDMIVVINNKTLGLADFDQAVTQLAIDNQCILVEGRTRRRGMCKTLIRLGWLAESINLVKVL